MSIMWCTGITSDHRFQITPGKITRAVTKARKIIIASVGIFKDASKALTDGNNVNYLLIILGKPDSP